MIIQYDADIERVGLSTKRLEREPGDMLKNPAAVYAQAEETAKLFRCAGGLPAGPAAVYAQAEETARLFRCAGGLPAGPAPRGSPCACHPSASPRPSPLPWAPWHARLRTAGLLCCASAAPGQGRLTGGLTGHTRVHLAGRASRGPTGCCAAGNGWPRRRPTQARRMRSEAGHPAPSAPAVGDRRQFCRHRPHAWAEREFVASRWRSSRRAQAGAAPAALHSHGPGLCWASLYHRRGGRQAAQQQPGWHL